MELSDLEAYLAVIEHNGFRRAAEALFVSQPSLTRRVSRLESELNVTLLDRGPRGIRLTRQGEALASGARRILATADEVRATTSGSWSDDIVLACTSTATGTYLADFLASWIPAHPDTRLKIIEDGPGRTRRRLTDHECDGALVAAPLEREFDSLPITRAHVKAHIPPGHRLASESGPLSVAELHREPVLINGEQYLSGQLLRSASRVAGVQLDVVFECTVGQTLVALVQAGIGIAVFSDAVGHHGYDVPARQLCDSEGALLGFDLRIAWSRDRTLNPVLHDFARDFSNFTRPLRDRAGQPD